MMRRLLKVLARMSIRNMANPRYPNAYNSIGETCEVMRIDRSWYDEPYYNARPEQGYGKHYLEADGTPKVWGYEGNADYMGYNIIMPVFKRVFHPSRMLAVGCGTGAEVKYSLRGGIDAYGFDFSDYAILTNPLNVPKFRLILADARYMPFRSQSFDFVFNTDLLEHIPEKDVELTVNDMFRISSRWVFSNIGGLPEWEPEWKGYSFDYGEEIPVEKQKPAAAGHLNVRRREYWVKKLSHEGWRLRDDLNERFTRLANKLGAVQFWFDIVIMEKEKP